MKAILFNITNKDLIILVFLLGIINSMEHTLIKELYLQKLQIQSSYLAA